MNGNGFEPRIVAFTCNWCSYAAADLAGTSRIHYPPNVRTVRVMCSGMVDPIFVLGVTLGLAITVGGVATPLLGRVADDYGLWTALAILSLVPLLSAAGAVTLPRPHSERARASNRR